MKKPNFYGSRRAFEAGSPHDGFLLERFDDGLSLVCRMESRTCRLEQLDGEHRYDDGTIAVRVGADGSIALDSTSPSLHAPHVVDIGRYHALATLLRGITDSTRVHAVNTPLLADSSS